MMIALLLNEQDMPHSEPFAAAVTASGIPVDAIMDAYRDVPEKLNVWGIGILPCLAVIVDDKAVYQVSNADKLWTFTADAAAAANA